jgi:hypothetical protein
MHTDEIYFRDTAHGFIAWAVALVISTAFFMSYATALAARPTTAADATRNYFVDMLFRTDHPTTARADQALRDEAGTVMAEALRRPETKPI